MSDIPYSSDEFMLEDDGSPSPLPDLNDAEGVTDGDGHGIGIGIGITSQGEDNGYLAVSPSVTFAKTPISPDSANGSGDSISDSSSSKRTTSTASTKTTLTNGDMTMSDATDGKAFQLSDFVHMDEDGLHNLDGNHDMFLGSGDIFSGNKPTATFDELGPNGTMGTPHFLKEEFSSPLGSGFAAEAVNSAFSDYGSVPRLYKDPSSISLTQSMYGLTTHGSREVSPLSTMNPSQTSSPTAFFHSPPAAEAFSFTQGPVCPPQWPGAPGKEASMQPNGGTTRLAEATPGHHTNGIILSQAAVYGPGPYNLLVHPIPQKSRVETQIPIKLTMQTLPPNIKKLHLPTHTISKPKLLEKPTPEPSPDTLELHTVLVCTTATDDPQVKARALERARTAAMAGRKGQVTNVPEGQEIKPTEGGEVNICQGCMVRERKRAARKKIKKPEDEAMWAQDESRRIIVFNTKEVKEWHSAQPESGITGFHVDAPMRIACYCRHHGEKAGFKVIFTITDYKGTVIAQEMSPNIMITDDHKTHTTGSNVGTVSEAALGQAPPVGPEIESSLSPPGVRLSFSSSDLTSSKRNASTSFPQPSASPVATHLSPGLSSIPTPRNLSRPASPTGLSGPCSKKRKSSGSPKVPTELAMTRLDTAPTQHSNPPGGGGSTSAATSPFSPSLTSYSAVSESVPFSSNASTVTMSATPMQQPFGAGPTTPGASEQPLFGGVGGTMDSIALASMYSAPASARPSRAPSPNSSLRALQQNGANFAQAITSLSGFHGMPNLTMPAIPQPPSVIHKIIPAEGPKSGGIEVTVLGGGFYQGLEVMFGDVRATTTTFWGETSLVCLLPPSPVEGTVRVTFKHQVGQPGPQIQRQHPLFKYVDDDEQQLMRTALAVMGAKMSGTFEDTRMLARRIIGENSAAWGTSSSGGNVGSGSGPFGSFSLNMDFESQLLKVLDLIDLDDSGHKARYNLKRSTGQTMLHLACSLGLNRFVAGLLARGANPDVRDKGGYTPLHMASLNDHPEIVRRLITSRADPTLRTLSGLTAADVAKSRAVLRAVRRVERHARSHSGGSLHSRASSANSLKSLWEPMTAAHTSEERAAGDETSSGEESPEYTSGDMASDAESLDADDEAWLDMRRSSTHKTPSQEEAQIDEPLGGLASPTAAVTALKEQFTAQIQQFQQAMAFHFQNLPQLPNLPQMPNMHLVPDYQTAVMQRLAAMVPNIGAFRPPAAGDATDPTAVKDLESRWWDLSSLVTSSAPPPSYEEIFPPDQVDRKQASAAQAAAEAESDSKCELLYDQAITTHTPPSATVTDSVSTATRETEQKLPALLQIGRKNAITREQQENLRRAHAERLKRLSRDRNLFFIWIPLLVVVLCAMLYNRFPGLFLAVGDFLVPVMFASRASEPASATAVAGVADRVVEIM